MKIDMEKVTSETIQQMGAQLAMLTYELNAQREANRLLQEQIEKPGDDGPKLTAA